MDDGDRGPAGRAWSPAGHHLGALLTPGAPGGSAHFLPRSELQAGCAVAFRASALRTFNGRVPSLYGV